MRNKIITSIVWGSIIAAASFFFAVDALARVNPFLTLQEEDFYAQNLGEEINGMNLSGVFSSSLNSYAVIDGKIYSVNDSYQGKTIVGMNSQKVRLRDSEGKEYFIIVGSIINKRN